MTEMAADRLAASSMEPWTKGWFMSQAGKSRKEQDGSGFYGTKPPCTTKRVQMIHFCNFLLNIFEPQLIVGN